MITGGDKDYWGNGDITGKDTGKDTIVTNRPDIYVLKLQKGQAYYLTELGKTLIEK